MIRFGDLVVDRRAEEDDALAQEQRVDVERALAPRAGLDDGRDDHLTLALSIAINRFCAHLRDPRIPLGPRASTPRPNRSRALGRAGRRRSRSASHRAASPRLLTPSLLRISETWNFAPSALMPSRRAISSFESPSRTSRRTSHCRGVSTSGCRGRPRLIGAPSSSPSRCRTPVAAPTHFQHKQEPPELHYPPRRGFIRRTPRPTTPLHLASPESANISANKRICLLTQAEGAAGCL